MFWEVKSCLEGQKIGQSAIFVFFLLLIKMAGWELLKIASNVELSVLVSLARSDTMRQTWFENPCAVRAGLILFKNKGAFVSFRFQ